MIIEEQCKNCEGMGYLLDSEGMLPLDINKKVCPVAKSSTSMLDFTHTTSCHVCFGIGYIFHHKRGIYENKNA